MGRVVAIDYGTKRVGIAVSDPLQLFAQPHGTVTPDATIVELERLHAADGIETIVVGWPVLPNGDEGAMTERVQEFVNRIKNRLGAIPVVKWDETYTSATASDMLLASGAKRKKRREKGVLDRLAASVMLEEYLSSIQGG